MKDGQGPKSRFVNSENNAVTSGAPSASTVPAAIGPDRSLKVRFNAKSASTFQPCLTVSSECTNL